MKLSYIHTYVATALVGLPDDQAAIVHLMHLLRVRMLHFILNLNNYLMTRVSFIFAVSV